MYPCLSKNATKEQLGLPVVSHELLDVPDRQLGDRGGGAGDGLHLGAELPAGKLLLEEREYRHYI